MVLQQCLFSVLQHIQGICGKPCTSEIPTRISLLGRDLESTVAREWDQTKRWMSPNWWHRNCITSVAAWHMVPTCGNHVFEQCSSVAVQEGKRAPACGGSIRVWWSLWKNMGPSDDSSYSSTPPSHSNGWSPLSYNTMGLSSAQNLQFCKLKPPARLKCSYIVLRNI